jgi:hypothetical protein
MRPISPTSQSRTGWMAFVIALSVAGEFKKGGRFENRWRRKDDGEERIWTDTHAKRL